jgi:hypothetical protein
MSHTIKLANGAAIRIRPYSGFVMLILVNQHGEVQSSELLTPEQAAAVIGAFEQVIGAQEIMQAGAL